MLECYVNHGSKLIWQLYILYIHHLYVFTEFRIFPNWFGIKFLLKVHLNVILNTFTYYYVIAQMSDSSYRSLSHYVYSLAFTMGMRFPLVFGSRYTTVYFISETTRSLSLEPRNNSRIWLRLSFSLVSLFVSFSLSSTYHVNWLFLRQSCRISARFTAETLLGIGTGNSTPGSLICAEMLL